MTARFGGPGIIPWAPLLLLVLLSSGCALTTLRPVQEMSDTQAAVKAAREVQADILAPELFRQANEWFSKARQEYRYKDFEKTLEYAELARTLAEKAELEAIKNGGTRGGTTEMPPPEPQPPLPAEAPSP